MRGVISAMLLALPGKVSADVSFRRDVMPVIAKAGCNMGSCHGNANGKGGFKLSLRGQDPAEDHLALTEALAGRRINLLEPEKSLLLLKATAKVAHQGGKRFGRDSEAYETLRRWIAEGAADDADQAPRLTSLRVDPTNRVLVEPEKSVRLSALAEFADGSRRDVSALAVYEPSGPLVAVSPEGLASAERPGEATVMVRFLEKQVPVRLAFVPERPAFQPAYPPEHNFIDRHVFAKLRALRIEPSELCDDTAFLRRAHLDLLGRVPTAQEAKDFAGEGDPNKRAKLIDDLLERPEFADFWALKWADLLHVDERPLDRKGARAFHGWLRRSIANRKPLDQFARELVSARGSTYLNPAANYYRSMRSPQERAEAAALVFLGTRLQCAQCHNHPSDRWTQDDYYHWGSVFAGVRYKVPENVRRDGNDKHEFDGEQVVFAAAGERMTNPRTGQPAAPRLLGAGPVKGDPLEELAEWMTSPDNPRFARAQVNRLWHHLMGRGLVDPVDDLRDINVASHPELLDELAQELVKSGFDMRHILRLIANSRTYQLSSAATEANRDDEGNYSHNLARRLPAEVLADSAASAMESALRFGGYPEGTRAVDLDGVLVRRERRSLDGPAEKFLKLFGKPPRLLASETERSNDSTLSQAFDLMNGPVLAGLLQAPNNILSRLERSEVQAEAAVEALFWSALSRAPSEEELAELAPALASPQDRRPHLEDLAWGLLNAKEFLLRY